MASASKFLQLGTALFRGHKAPSQLHPSIIYSAKPFIPSQSQSLRFPTSSSYCSSAAVDTVTALDGAEDSRHPWPEWTAFVDRLTTKGYFSETLAEDEADSLYKNMNLLKDPCLSFARDRYDVLKSLSTKDIEVIVGSGCPNLLRKAVNSAKRLRAYVRLDEGDVCSACNLRGSCDRAYTILKEFEADARTVDIVRVLLFYALDPIVISGGEKPVGRELVESSARKLLSELLELSETSVDPSLPKPAAKVPKQKEKSLSLTDDDMSNNVEMKRGDWICPNCNFMNFSKNLRCLKCKHDGPKSAGKSEFEIKKGDWSCPECNFTNFARNIRCLKCKAEGPKKSGGSDIEMKKGDWNCPKCEFMNFASNAKCLRCLESRPKRLLNPGEWECPSCDFLNYRRNTACLKCKCDRPKEAASSEYQENIWRRPR
ncbi:zinc finger protein VAR3, chloroplastic isoform X1 [Humulus lupulus]|uniref:zinc finger protein VAR3, chloroplastic isoform X1 n=1 Tax=Humulus lupulus TaxID=3486 RepID=UPI002B40C72B|nr:zinc finger protein VAR3, chloroplastic isoform X1 [Humulus lupulus]